MADRAPVIGITAGELTATYGSWTERCTLLAADYVHAVARAGGVPVVLAAADGIASSVASRIDGLVLSGGADLDPDLFGALPHPEAQHPDRRRDRFELDLLDAVVYRGVPVLAICRGIQVVNVWRGGTLHQHLPDIGASPDHLGPPGAYGIHRVRLDPASRIGALLGPEIEAPTHHHQAVDQLGTGLQACGWSDDGMVEALEDPSVPLLVAVQWHPEAGKDPRLFEHLVEAARQR
jgi:putative glutamine amidotransferase